MCVFFRCLLSAATGRSSAATAAAAAAGASQFLYGRCITVAKLASHEILGRHGASHLGTPTREVQRQYLGATHGTVKHRLLHAPSQAPTNHPGRAGPRKATSLHLPHTQPQTLAVPTPYPTSRSPTRRLLTELAASKRCALSHHPHQAWLCRSGPRALLLLRRAAATR